MKQLLGIFLIVGLFSCQEKQVGNELIEADDLSTEQIDSILTEFKFKYESPIILKNTTQVLIPISTELLERRSKFSRDGYQTDDYPRYWNVLFYNRLTGVNNLLTEEKIRISQIYANEDEYEGRKNIMKNKVLYQISNIDFNKDGKLNGQDPEFLFTSEIDGTKFKRISPVHEDLQYFEVISESDEILIKTLRDTNQDLIFDREDESIWYSLKMENFEWESNELIDSISRKGIGNLYFDQWLKKK